MAAQRPVHVRNLSGAAVSHLAELVRGEFPSWEGPLIRPFGPPSPQGEKGRAASGCVLLGVGAVSGGADDAVDLEHEVAPGLLHGVDELLALVPQAPVRLLLL